MYVNLFTWTSEFIDIEETPCIFRVAQLSRLIIEDVTKYIGSLLSISFVRLFIAMEMSSIMMRFR